MRNIFTFIFLIWTPVALATDSKCPSPEVLKNNTNAAIKLAGNNKLSESASILDAACKCNFIDACGALGVNLMEEASKGWFQGKKKEEGERLLRESCEKGSGYGCLQNGYTIHNKLNSSLRAEEDNFYRKSCELKHRVGCFEYAKSFVTFQKAEDSCQKETGLSCSEARKKFSQQACDLGNAEGCYDVSQSLPSEADLPNLKKACDGLEDPKQKKDACNSYSRVSSSAEATKKYGQALSYSELDRLTHVGMKIGKTYRVSAKNSPHESFNAIVPVQKESTVKFKTVETDLLSEQQRGVLFDLGQGVGCFFVVLMGNGKLSLTDVKQGVCE